MAKRLVIAKTKKCVSGLILAAYVLLVAQNAHALNGYIFVTDCLNCSTASEFVSAATSRATVLVKPGMYAVMSQNFDRTAYVRVTGTIKTRMREGMPESVLTNVSGAAVDAAGAPVTSDAQFDQIDQVMLGANRSRTITGVRVPSNYAGSFINSQEEEVVPGIGYALAIKGINPASIPAGTLITVTFDDGTTAQYVKASATATYQWTWNGIAHNAQGKRINRDGTLKSNPNSGGAGGGEARNVRDGRTYRIIGGGMCGASGSISENGVVTLSYSYNYLPC